MIDLLVSAYEYLMGDLPTFFQLLREHLILVFTAEIAAILLAVPVGIFATRNDIARKYGLTTGNIFHTIPPLAIIAIVFPIVGIGLKAGFVALFVYGLLPILINTITGIEEVDESLVKAAKGMGMTDRQILVQIQLPTAIPTIFAGIRTSTVINVGNAYLAFFIGAGGLGDWVITGITMFNTPQILAGAIPGALLAIFLDLSLSAIEKRLDPSRELLPESTGATA
jgi:osmoprotectant transport system permease protein